MRTHTITGGGGVDLRVDETGDPDGQAILFIHGYSQSRLCWTRQLGLGLAAEFRLVAVDNRGHGRSDKPVGVYVDSTLWAEDGRSVIEGLGLDRPVLVGWSYGGLIVADYLKAYSDEHIAGVNLAGAAPKSETEDALAVIGEDFTDRVPGFESTDARESVTALERLLRDCTHEEPSPADLSFMFGYNACRHTPGPACTPGR
jgi:Predicted hydrolases or acyltransferases (alpha/beta hydrolase superfamily)